MGQNKWLKENDEQYKSRLQTQKITLLEELLGHFLTPLFAKLPRSAGVADVRTLQSHLDRVRIKK